MDLIASHEKDLTMYTMERLSEVPGLTLIGTAPNKSSVISYIVDGVSSENVAKYLNNDGIAVRAGHHCAQPILKRHGLSSCVRASIGLYNTKEEIESLARSTLKIMRY